MIICNLAKIRSFDLLPSITTLISTLVVIQRSGSKDLILIRLDDMSIFN